MTPAPEMRHQLSEFQSSRSWCACLFSPIWKICVLVVGLTVVLIGVIMIVTPGPAIVVIPLGLAILGTEFVWARNLLHVAKERISRSYHQLTDRKSRS